LLLKQTLKEFYMSIILNTDSYKVSMWKQYPEGTEYVYSYIESRGGKYDRTEFLGVQAFAKEISKPITQADIDLADRIWTAHGEPFNRAGWQYILDVHGGRLPIRIRAAKEGLVIPTKNVLAVIENTDPKCFWLTTWVETAALRAIWYPTTVGTISWHIKQEILAYLEKSGDPGSIAFKLHDFGARGVSSEESARIGGAAHLVNFMGTDTMSGILHVMDVYGDDVPGFSIPAAEHSTITSWGRSNEVDAYRNMVKQFGGEGKIVAVVSDSYDIYKACEMWGTELKDDVLASGATVVIRPDSGDPMVVVPKMLHILSDKFGYTKNSKGYKVLNNVRIIWGDGINSTSLSSILRCVVDVAGWSADNIAFGMGGGLLQQLDRDTLKFAMKCSSIGIRPKNDSVEFFGRKIGVNIEWRDVFKDPATDQGKSSKKGRVTLWESGGEYKTATAANELGWTDRGFFWKDALETYFEDGEVKFTQTFDQVRVNSCI
jgi:nicotinamide phosphoribosyltransferase